MHTSNKNKKRVGILKLAQEYRNLMRLSSPSNEELDRIEKILELAIYDIELNDLLYLVDEQFSFEINLIENENLDYSSMNNVNFNEEYYSQILSKDISILEARPLKQDLIHQSEDSCNVVSFPELYVPNTTNKWNWQICGNDFKHTIFIFVAGGVLASVRNKNASSSVSQASKNVSKAGIKKLNICRDRKDTGRKTKSFSQSTRVKKSSKQVISRIKKVALSSSISVNVDLL
ncbi:hypothetical protein [Nostoc sp. 'Peltigera membranacea cyanobiont' N6]|uniref:hypothetical protein n=1 Tax=Nostoc sp. 'Peltigera membranacea cyanobiont' N6 TaxID=1261031 RepID=UPI0011B0C86D|nr:hypothetical protein [Nostoc sp. 'Peltigera membranacea cyanobiont' N6]